MLLLLRTVDTTVSAANRAKGPGGDRSASGRTEAVAEIRENRPRLRAVVLVVAAACVLATALPLPAQLPVRVVGVVQWVEDACTGTARQLT
jgi:hypothetical protein